MDTDEKICRELLSRNIKKFREKLGFSQIDLALELDISTTFLSDIETCQKWVSAHTLAKIARALKIDIRDLFTPETDLNDRPVNPEIAAEVIKHLDTVDNTLAKQITHYIQPAIEKAVQRVVRHSLAKTRTYYEGQPDGRESVPTA
jgi:transcriptional regulator with XRE-family HTH domain